jgi:hypothetical protein
MTAFHLFFFLALACMVGVLISLLLGVVAMTKGQEKDHQTSNKMMRMRVLLQGAAIFFLLLASLAR